MQRLSKAVISEHDLVRAETVGTRCAILLSERPKIRLMRPAVFEECEHRLR
jgi:hypothetical protein